MRFYLFSKEDFVISVVKSERTDNANICYLAGDLEYKIIRMTLNEKYFPKRSRYVITNKLVEAIMNVSANFYAANSIFPNKEEKLQLREQYQTIGKANLNVVKHQINLSKRLFNIPSGIIEELFSTITEIEKMYSNWVKSNKKILNREIKKQQEKSDSSDSDIEE